MAFFLQASARIVFSALLLGVAVISFSMGAEPGEAYTPRQQEILRELASYHPPGFEDVTDWMLGEWDTDTGMETLADPPDGEGNAASQFRLLEELYPVEKEMLESGGVDARGVEALLRAADMRECRLIPEYYPPYETVEARQPDFMVMRSYLGALLRRAENAEKNGDAAEVRRCYRAAMQCGRHLTTDRSSVLIYLTGLIFKLRGAQEYGKYLVRASRLDQAVAANAYVERLTVVLRLFYWKSNVALGETAGFACLPAAVRIAVGDAEVCWRKEAVVRLAMLRHGVPDAETKSLRHDTRFEELAETALMRAAMEDVDVSLRKLAAWSAMNLKPEESYAHRFE